MRSKPAAVGGRGINLGSNSVNKLVMGIASVGKAIHPASKMQWSKLVDSRVVLKRHAAGLMVRDETS